MTSNLTDRQRQAVLDAVETDRRKHRLTSWVTLGGEVAFQLGIRVAQAEEFVARMISTGEIFEADDSSLYLRPVR